LTQSLSVGPLQSQVSEPNLIDWQNNDWIGWVNETQDPEAMGAFPMMGDEGFFEFGTSYIHSNSLFYMGFPPIGAFNEPLIAPGLGNHARFSPA
jgi:hypothetical protein